MKKGTFLLFSQFYLPHVGGIEKYVYNFSKELEKHGHDVIIITANLDNKNNISVKKLSDKVKIINLNCISILKNRFLIPYSLHQLTSLINEVTKIKKSSSIVSIGQTRFFPIPIFGALLSFFIKVPSIIIDHSSNYLPSKNKFLRKLFILYEKFSTGLLKKLNVEFAGVSEASINWLKNFNIDTKLIISNGIDIGKLEFYKDKHSNNQLQRKNKILFTSGRLISEKGFLEIIDAFNEFSIQKNNYLLLIAGEGELEEQIARRTNNKIIFLGKLNNDEIMSVLKKCDLFIFASNYPEGLPTVLLEAGIASVPIMSTEIGGSKEILGNGERGIILDNPSVNEIKNKLLWFDSHISDATLMARKLNKFVIKNYNWEKIINIFLKKYE